MISVFSELEIEPWCQQGRCLSHDPDFHSSDYPLPLFSEHAFHPRSYRVILMTVINNDRVSIASEISRILDDAIGDRFDG